MDIKTFRKLFAEKVLEQIGSEGFLYKSSRVNGKLLEL